MTTSDPAAIAAVFIATGMLACVAIIGIYLRYRTKWRLDQNYDRIEKIPRPAMRNGRRGQ